MNSEYATFIRSLDDLKEGQEIELTILDLTAGTHKYKAKRVKAIVSDSPHGGDVLWARFLAGILHPKPLGIKIVTELPPVYTNH